MDEYLAALPRGINSYPDYVMKAATYREFLAEIPEGGIAELGALPPTLRELVERPLPVSDWLPEVHANALFMAIADAFFPSDDAFAARKLETNRRMLRSPLYRVLFLLATPETMLRNVTSRWVKFHKGILLRVPSIAERSAKLRVDFPPNLVPHLQARAYVAAVQAALEAAGAKEVESSISSWSSTFINVDAAWK
jgi:hypothetical protein